MNTQPSYEDVCKYVGQLFLATQFQTEHFLKQLKDAESRIDAAGSERDSALNLLKHLKHKDEQENRV